MKRLRSFVLNGRRREDAIGETMLLLIDGEPALACASGRLEELRIALAGTNPLPLLVSGTDELVGKQVDESLLVRISKLVQKQASPVRTTLTQANYRRQVAAVTAQRLVRELAAL